MHMFCLLACVCWLCYMFASCRVRAVCDLHSQRSIQEFVISTLSRQEVKDILSSVFWNKRQVFRDPNPMHYLITLMPELNCSY